jgi:membrane dipeptidase
VRASPLLVLVLVSCAGARPLTQPQPPAAEAPAFAVDAHLHLTMSHAAVPLFKGEPGSGWLSDSPSVRLVNQVEADQLEKSGVKLVLGALWPPLPFRPGRDSTGETVHQLWELDRFALRRPAFAVARTAAEARAAVKRGQVAVVPQVEGGEGITSVADVDRLYAAGARCVTLVHFVDSQLGGAAKGQLTRNLLRLNVEGKNPQGLTELGKAVVTRMMDLGIVVDIAHASDRTADDVLTLAEARGVPVLLSHAGARALSDMERNVPDALAQRVAKGGGLVGVTLFSAQAEVGETGQLAHHEHGTCDDIVAHWKHLASVVPPASLILGSDFNGFIVRPASGGLCPHGVRNAGDLGDVWSALLANGVPREALDGMGEAFLRLFEQVEAHASPEVRAQATRSYLLAPNKPASLFDAP